MLLEDAIRQALDERGYSGDARKQAEKRLRRYFGPWRARVKGAADVRGVAAVIASAAGRADGKAEAGSVSGSI